MFELVSPLKAWPGKVKLPQANDFSGTNWQVWKKAVNRPKRSQYALTHLYCYSGLELIEVAGEWDFKIPLAEIKAWEDDPDAERIKLVAWLGREMMVYMDSIMDPKE